MCTLYPNLYSSNLNPQFQVSDVIRLCIPCPARLKKPLFVSNETFATIDARMQAQAILNRMPLSPSLYLVTVCFLA